MNYVTLEGTEKVLLKARFKNKYKKHGFNHQVTITGEDVVQSVDVKINGVLTINECDQDQFDSLFNMWADQETVEITDQFGRVFIVSFIDQELDLEPDDDNDGTLFYYGTIRFGG